MDGPAFVSILIIVWAIFVMSLFGHASRVAAVCGACPLVRRSSRPPQMLRSCHELASALAGGQDLGKRRFTWKGCSFLGSWLSMLCNHIPLALSSWALPLSVSSANCG
jgi:hypothetical protein